MAQDLLQIVFQRDAQIRKLEECVKVLEGILDRQKADTFTFEYSHTSGAEVVTYSAPHELHNAVEIRFPAGYFDGKEVPESVSIAGFQFNDQKFSDAIAPSRCRGCGSQFKIAVDVVASMRRDIDGDADVTNMSDQEIVNIWGPDICLECLDGKHRNAEHVVDFSATTL